MTTELSMHIGLKNGTTVLDDHFFTSPIKIGMPAAGTKRLHLMVMMASAGLLKGDRIVSDICCEAGTKARLTEQSYTKIFDTGDGSAAKKRRIRLKGDASFYDCPSAVIPFKNSTFDGETIVELDRESEFAWSDIMAVGRIGMKEAFEFRHYRNKVSVRVEDVLVWMDHCLLEPAHMETEGMFFFDGYTHQGTFYYYGPSEKTERVKMWHEASAPKWHRQHLFGLTEARAGICIRVLAKTAQDIEELFADLAEKLELDR